MQVGLSLLARSVLRVWRIVSEDSLSRNPHGLWLPSRSTSVESFLLIIRTGRIVTCAKQVAPDTRTFQHIARFYNGLGSGFCCPRSHLEFLCHTAPVDRYSYGRRSPGLRFKALSVETDEPFPLTFRHWAGVSPYTSPFGLAETCVFDKQSPGPLYCGPQGPPSGKRTSPHGHPFSQSYRAKLSNSLTRVHSFTSGLIPQPTCVGFRYGRQYVWQRDFSRRHRFNEVPQGSGPKVLTPLNS